MMPMLEPPIAGRTPKRWTKREYNAGVERGWFAKTRIYLYRGELYEPPPMGTAHARGITRLNSWLMASLHPTFVVRPRAPFELVDDSMPEPDVVVVTTDQETHRPHPRSAVLVVEVADCTVELDRQMADDYAAAQVPDYWIDNVRDRQIEVHRDPRPDPASPTGHRYATRRTYTIGESLAPLAMPTAVVAVATLVNVA